MTNKETFERVCELYKAENNDTAFRFVDVNEEYYICIMDLHKKVRINLMKITSGKPVRVAYEAINAGATDKVIMNRYNKLVEMVK